MEESSAGAGGGCTLAQEEDCIGPEVKGYIAEVVSQVWDGLSHRARAKALLKLRNRRVAHLRGLLREPGGGTAPEVWEELTNLQCDEQHWFRALLVLQPAFRGHLLRARMRRAALQLGDGSSDARRFSALLQAAHCWHDPLEGRVEQEEHGRYDQLLSMLPSSLPSMLSMPFMTTMMPSMSVFGFEQEAKATYPGTRVPRVPLPTGRSERLPRRVYIYYSDTGGGHRASATALQAALHRLYGPQVSVELADFSRTMPWPFCAVPEGYQVLGRLPSVWKAMYDVEHTVGDFRETRAFRFAWYTCRESVLRLLSEAVAEGADLLISVHPLINHVICEALDVILGDETRLVPFVTVVTDLGTAHFSWFEPRAHMLFVPSEEVQELALSHQVPKARVQLCGLPLREGFWEASRAPKKTVQAQLGLRPADRPEVVLLMSGGEGFGAIFQVATRIGDTLARRGEGQLVVVCGRNEEARRELEAYEWLDYLPPASTVSRFTPSILGFVSNVHEYMAAADILVSKAGPGTIAEAMIYGLPCLLTSYLPGQEEANVDFVIDNGVGEFVPDHDPDLVANTVMRWLNEPRKLGEMSRKGLKLAKPQATLDIARRICSSQLNLSEVHPETGQAVPSCGCAPCAEPQASSSAQWTPALR